jgi:hypothetical protein
MEHALRKSTLFYILIAILMFGISSCKEDSSDEVAVDATINGYCMISGVANDDGTFYRCYKFSGTETNYASMSGICTNNLEGVMSKTDACSTENLVTPDGEAAGMICQDRWFSPRSALLGTVKTDYYLYTNSTVNSGTLVSYYADNCTGNQDDDPSLPFEGTFVAP